MTAWLADIPVGAIVAIGTYDSAAEYEPFKTFARYFTFGLDAAVHNLALRESLCLIGRRSTEAQVSRRWVGGQAVADRPAPPPPPPSSMSTRNDRPLGRQPGRRAFAFFFFAVGRVLVRLRLLFFLAIALVSSLCVLVVAPLLVGNRVRCQRT